MLFAPLIKISEQSDGSLLVGGYASTSDVDSDGEIIPDDVIRAALPGYLKYPTIRTMHRPNPVGSTIYAKQDAKGTFIEAKVFDELAKTQVRNGVLRGFSIGGSILKRDAKNPKLIKAIRMSEISLVDSPANKSCEITMWKRDKFTVLRPTMFADLHKGRDVSTEPRNSSGEWTTGGGNASASNGRDVILEDRGHRRGRPWGSVAGAVGAGVAGALVAARRPSRIAAVLAGSMTHAAGGAALGALRGAKVNAAWPVKVLASAGGAGVGAVRGAVNGAQAGASRPALYNAVMGGALAAAGGATIGGAVGELAGGMHDRINTYRIIDKSVKSRRLQKFNSNHEPKSGKFSTPAKHTKQHQSKHGTQQSQQPLHGGISGLIDLLIYGKRKPTSSCKSANSSDLAKARQARIAGIASGKRSPSVPPSAPRPQPKIVPIQKRENALVSLAKFASDQPRDEHGQFASAGNLAVAGGVLGGLAGDHLAHAFARTLPAPAAVVTRLAGAALGEVLGHHAGYAAGQALATTNMSAGHDAAIAQAHHSARDQMVAALKANISATHKE